MDGVVKEGIREQINSIPRIQSNYLRSTTTREFVEGGNLIDSIY